ncbi:MAG: hypothetical protein IKS51_05890 [Erysipelotrichaceae bacterium]|nr:hypothetical protein [Erysipelotrichaceae bacterium]
MAKLTRTQKYATLRDNLANDSESSLSTKDLSTYENKLNDITARSEARKPAPSSDEVTWVDYPDLMSVDDLVDSFINKNKQAVEQTPEPVAVQPEPVRPEPVIKPQPPIDSSFENKISEIIDDVSLNNLYNTAPVVNEPVRQETPQTVQIQKEIAELEEKPETPFMGYYHNPSIEPVHQEVRPEPVVTPYVQQPVTYQPAPEPVRPEPVVNPTVEYPQNTAGNSLINEVIDEVDQHIKASGEQNIGQITNEIVDEIRHAERPVYPETAAKEDETYSNTVSMEISKIMDEMIDTAPTKPIQEENRQPEPVVNEHPVLAKTLEEEKAEDIVEIKNIDEIDLGPRPTKEAPTGTIPFIVSATDDEDLIEDDEEGSNTILNIILVILIIILLAVLGLIIFYILKTKGII